MEGEEEKDWNVVVERRAGTLGEKKEEGTF